MSSTRAVNRVQRACPHCGAVTLVSSCRMRDLYGSPMDDDAGSAIHGSVPGNSEDNEMR